MKVFLYLSLPYALCVCTFLTTACTSPGYNENPSQQIKTARVGCQVATDFFSVYFSLHVQPSIESPDARVTKELFRSYCNYIPMPGKVFLTADLVGVELRKIPIGIRVVEKDAGGPGYAGEIRAIEAVPPRTYTKGFIETSFVLERSGNYVIYLTRGGADAVSEEDRLAIPLYVGIDAEVSSSMIGMTRYFGFVAGLVLIVFAAYRAMRGRSQT